MLTVKTESGSTYRIDTEAKHINRVDGGDHYRGRMVKGAHYYNIIGPDVGKSMVILWEDDLTTVTSKVTSIA